MFERKVNIATFENKIFLIVQIDTENSSGFVGNFFSVCQS